MKFLTLLLIIFSLVSCVEGEMTTESTPEGEGAASPPVRLENDPSVSYGPTPSPSTYTGSPFSVTDTSTETISVVISNPDLLQYTQFFYVDNVQQGLNQSTAATATFGYNFTPQGLGSGTHTVISELRAGLTTTGRLISSATWVFEVSVATQPSQINSPGFPAPLPIPTSATPLTRTSSPINLRVDIIDSSNLGFTQEWWINNVTEAASSTTSTSSFQIDPSNTTLFPILGPYTIESRLKSGGATISSLFWSVEIAGNDPAYSDLDPDPSPATFLGSPFATTDTATQTISVNVSNPDLNDYTHIFYVNNVQQLPIQSSSAETATFTYNFTPQGMAAGTYTVVSELREGLTSTGTLLNSATWVFEVTATQIFQPSQIGNPLPIPNLTGTFSLTRNSSPTDLDVTITDTSNLGFTQEWFINNSSASTPTTFTSASFTIDPSDVSLFPILGLYTIESRLISGGATSTLFWTVDIVGNDPAYSNLIPWPSPATYTDSPYSIADTSTKTISVGVSNFGPIQYNHSFFVDGGLPITLLSTATEATYTYDFTPQGLGPGTHTVVSQLREGLTSTGTLINSATWVFEVSELPQFSSFSDPQLPSPAPFPDVVFGSSQVVSLDPGPLYNPVNATFTVYWKVDGATDTSKTFNGNELNNDPPAFVVSATDTTFGVGNHSVVAMLYDDSTASPTLVDSVSWSFNVVFPPTATLTNVAPEASDITPNTTNLPANASNTEIAVVTVPLSSSTSGFFVGPGNESSRGTALVIGTNSFCVKVSDGMGIGDPSPGTGVQVQYSYANGADINPLPLQFAKQASPTDICLDGTGALNSGDGAPNFSLNTVGPTYITARITDKLSLQTIATVQWNIIVEDLNTTPTITIDDSAGIPETATVTQDATFTVSFTVADKDGNADSNFATTFSFSSPINASDTVLDGTNTYYPGGPTSPKTPDCERDYSYTGPDNKFSCTLEIPSNDGSSPIPASGTYTVKAIVKNLSIYPNGSAVESSPTNLYNPEVSSNELVWNLIVQESNSGAPTLNGIILNGPAIPSTNSYIFNSLNNSVAISTASEGDFIQFSVNASDPELNNYIYSLSYNASGTFNEFFNSTPTSFPSGTGTTSTPTFKLEETLVNGVPSGVVIFRVRLTDVTTTAAPKSNEYFFTVTVFNLNPIPVVASSGEDPAFDATATVVQGFPFTLETPEITDASTSPDGQGILWQWMINKNPLDCTNTTASTWEIITGAIQGSPAPISTATAELVWSPPYLSTSTEPFCFRNCIGDTGGNAVNCSVTMAGPWVGPITGVPADTGSLSGLVGATATTAIWADPNVSGSVYVANVNGNIIHLVNYVYALDGSVTEIIKSFPTVESEVMSTTSTEIASDLSITGNSSHVFVGYLFKNDGGTPSGVKVPTVVRLEKSDIATATVDYFVDFSKQILGVGQVVANDDAFWLPYINQTNGDLPWVLYGDGQIGTDTYNASLGPLEPSSLLQSRSDNNNKLYLASKLLDGTVNLYSFDMEASPTVPINMLKVEDIFNPIFVPFLDMSLAVGDPSTNTNIFVVGKDTNNKTLFYSRRVLSTLADDGVFALTATSTYPQAYDDLGFNAVASTVLDELIVSVIKNESSNINAYLLKIKDSGVQVSRIINQTTVSNSSNSGDFAISNVIPDFVQGSAGAGSGENEKDTLWFRYHNNSEERNVILNIENEVFTLSSPSTPTDLWSAPWFVAP